MESLLRDTAKRTFALIAEAASVGDFEGKREDVFKSYKDVSSKILELFLKENIKVGDINEVLNLTRVPIESVGDIVVQSMNKHLEELQEKMLGKQPKELTMLELDDYIKGIISEPVGRPQPTILKESNYSEKQNWLEKIFRR